ncbi:MAG: ATP-binding protein [bacterium]
MNRGLVEDYILEYTKRPIPPLIERDLRIAQTDRIISIIGPRRAGKTYYFYQLMRDKKEKALYLNFEDTRLIELNFKEIRDLIRIYKEFRGKEPEYLFLDEIQNIQNWELAIREILDTQRYKIFITGSSSKLLSYEIATSLRGRTFKYLLLPFSFSEFLKAEGSPLGEALSKEEKAEIRGKLRRYLEFGGFPELVKEKEKERILKGFYELILFRDLVERHKLKNIALARFLLSNFSQNLSCEMSINKIFNFLKSQGKRVGKNTLYDYCEKIEDSVSVFFLLRYSEKIYQKEAWPKKVYLCDTGLSKVVRAQEDIGKLMENAVFLELLRRQNERPLIELYYYKDTSGKEIDFVLKEKTKVEELIQVCYNIEEIKTKEREFKSLITGAKRLNCQNLTVITWDLEAEEEFKGFWVNLIPLTKWLIDKG